MQWCRNKMLATNVYVRRKLSRFAGHSSKCIICDPRFLMYRSSMLLYIPKVVQVSLISEHKFLYIPEYSGTSTNVVPGT